MPTQDEQLIAYLKTNKLYGTFLKAATAGDTVALLVEESVVKDATAGDVHVASTEEEKPKPTVATVDPEKDDEVTKALSVVVAKVLEVDVTFAKGDANLYVSRPLTTGSAQRLSEWLDSTGIANPVPPELMHVTQVHSKAEVDGLEPLSTLLDVGPGRWLGSLGKDGKALVMHFSSPEMQRRFIEAKAKGATYDFDSYRPHITLSYDAAGSTDWLMVDAPDFPIQLGPEVFQSSNDNWVADNGLAKGDFEMVMKVSEVREDQHIIGGWASIASVNGVDVIDKQGDIIPVEELEKAFHEYVLYSRDHGDMHEKRGTGRLIACMTFTPEKAAAGIFAKNENGEALMGTWVEYLISDMDVWKRIKAGELPEFSIGGRATPTTV